MISFEIVRGLERPLLVLVVVLRRAEVRRVVVGLQLRNDGSHAVSNVLEAPLVVREERMRLDLLNAFQTETDASIAEKGADESFGLVAQWGLMGVGKDEAVLVVHDVGVGV